MNKKTNFTILTGLLSGSLMMGCSQQQTQIDQQVMDTQIPAKVVPTMVEKPMQIHQPMVKPKQVQKVRPMVKPKQVVKVRPM